MTGHDWFSFAQWAVGAVIAALAWIFGTGRMIERISNRMDQAGELLSDLTGKVQAMPTQDAMTAVWREMNRIETEQREDQRKMASMSERVSFLEGQRGNGK
jgi:hypothetical protein